MRGPENGASGDRASRLSAAILRVSASLDLPTVLQEVVESARALTGARMGVITTIDPSGGVEDFVVSGLAPEERREMVEWPDGPRLFAHLRDLPAPIRVADVDDYLRSLGMSPNPWGSKTLQGTPMHRGGEHLGHFFLADKEDGGAFTGADEEILVLFASQAAAAIANARIHRGRLRGEQDQDLLVRARERLPVLLVGEKEAAQMLAAPPHRGALQRLRAPRVRRHAERAQVVLHVRHPERRGKVAEVGEEPRAVGPLVHLPALLGGEPGGHEVLGPAR